jgi:hypothetical protein
MAPRKSKRQKTVETPAMTADALSVVRVDEQQRDGTIKQKRVLVPITANATAPGSSKRKRQEQVADDIPVDPYIPDYDGFDPSQNDHGPKRKVINFVNMYYLEILQLIWQKTKPDHLNEFKDNIHLLLAGLMAREFRHGNATCNNCQEAKIAIWRCRDCSCPPLLCRGCMRNTHFTNPLHRIECWNGKYFRVAHLWEVGVHLLVPHHGKSQLCASLEFQTTHLEDLQMDNDDNEQKALQAHHNISTAPHTDNIQMENWNLDDDDEDTALPDEEEDDDIEDAIYNPLHPDPVTNWAQVYATASLNNPAPPADAPAAPWPLHDNHAGGPIHLPHPVEAGPELRSPGTVPRTDDMMNTYVCVVHTNGLHDICLVYCKCQGHTESHADLLYSRLVPTTFSRYSTLFTADVLDDFRLSNLECKTSAYQYFQKLRRKTSPTAPADVTNRYHELRRLAREWRWLKKIKWGGYAHTLADVNSPKPGELTLFCPACPQPGVNLREDWKDDPNRYPPFSLDDAKH